MHNDNHAITNVNNKIDVNVLKTASTLGIKYYRANWLKYTNVRTMEADLEFYKQHIRDLSLLNKDLDIVGCYQNHAGRNIGSSIWEIKKLLEIADGDYFGAQYDIRHAVVEGALSWENGLHLIKDNIKTIVLKDFQWEKVNGTWNPFISQLGKVWLTLKNTFRSLKSTK